MSTATAAPGPVSTFEQRVRRRRLEHALRALHAPDWEQRLAPLAQHMAQNRLVRARGYAGTPVRYVDVGVLREALSRLLGDNWAVGSLIIQLVVEGQELSEAAAQRGVSRPALVEQLRDAVGALAYRYELLANGHLNAQPVVSLRAPLPGKHG